MAMPNLDPFRYVDMILANPSDKLPLPDKGGRFFLKEGELVDTYDPVYASLIADGSLILKPTTSHDKKPVETSSDDTHEHEEKPVSE